jgi:hypothetical protein
MTNKNFKKKQKSRAPLGSKRAQGHPLVAEGCGALLNMPSKCSKDTLLHIVPILSASLLVAAPDGCRSWRPPTNLPTVWCDTMTNCLMWHNDQLFDVTQWPIVWCGTMTNCLMWHNDQLFDVTQWPTVFWIRPWLVFGHHVIPEWVKSCHFYCPEMEKYSLFLQN